MGRVAVGITALACAHAAQASIVVSNVSQEMYAYLRLFDGYGIDSFEDGFDFQENTPTGLDETRTATVNYQGINEAVATLNTVFGADTLSGAATLTATHGNLAPHIEGSNHSHVVVGFTMSVDSPTVIDYAFAIGTAAGGNATLADVLTFVGSDGTPDLWVDELLDFPETSGTMTMLPGVTYTLHASVDTGFLYDNFDLIPAFESLTTAFTYSITVVPAPGAAALLAALTLPRRRHR